jgi:hypothetical protein
MNKTQLRAYAKKFENVSDIVRIIFGIVALLLFLKLMNIFTTTTAMATAFLIYGAIVVSGYWWVRREWRALLAPLPKKPKKKPEQKAAP